MTSKITADSLLKLEFFDRLRELWKFQQIKAEYSKNIIYRHAVYDGILSGVLRWNGALFAFRCVADEEDFPWPVEEYFEGVNNIDPIRSCYRYYAVSVHSTLFMKHLIKQHISACINVNPRSEYRAKKYKSRIVCPPNWLSWKSKPWSAVLNEEYDGTVVAWFRL